MENEELDKTEDPREKIIDNIDKDKDDKHEVNRKRLFHQEIDKTISTDCTINKQPKICTDQQPEINVKYLDENFMLKFKNNWNECHQMNCDSPTFLLQHKPFKISILQDFLQYPAFIESLVNEMSNLKWTRKQMDLYEFHQTTDLSALTQPYIQKFYKMLNDQIKPWMEQLINEKLTHVSASCSMYNNGDHLLVHDDLLADRVIAYVFYLTPWPTVYEWSSSMGGALELFETNENTQPIYPNQQEIYPKNNQFLFFQVSPRSFHQVGEVTTLDYPRLTINGWFHGSVNHSIDTKLLNSRTIFTYREATNESVDLNNWINESYLETSVKTSIQQHIEKNSEACLELFLNEGFFNAIEEELKSNDNQWTRQGPCNQCNYEFLQVTATSGAISDLIKIMSSMAMFQLFYELTELDFAGTNANHPKCSIRLCRLTRCSYSLLSDQMNEYNSLDVIMYFNAKNNVGLITYLNPNDENDGSISSDNKVNSDDEDSILLTLQPKNNALNVVYRTEGTTAFIKYISKSCIKDNKFVYLLIASYVE